MLMVRFGLLETLYELFDAFFPPLLRLWNSWGAKFDCSNEVHIESSDQSKSPMFALHFVQITYFYVANLMQEKVFHLNDENPSRATK